MYLELSKCEILILQKVLRLGICNGNRVDLLAFDPSPNEYKIICSLFNRLVEENNEV